MAIPKRTTVQQAQERVQAEALFEELVKVDQMVFHYSVELRCAGKLRLWIEAACAELKQHVEVRNG
jgi:hypothetical protein